MKESSVPWEEVSSPLVSPGVRQVGVVTSSPDLVTGCMLFPCGGRTGGGIEAYSRDEGKEGGTVKEWRKG